MAASSRMSEELLIPRKSWTHTHKTANRGLIGINNISDRSQVRNQANLKTMTASPAVLTGKVPVLYYLSRNGHLDHPHLIDVPLSSPHGLYLRDVMKTLNCYRGKGTANMYSWSYKRSYKNGYVWHDASEDDLIQPSNNHDYILKGSELLQTNASQNQPETYLTVRRNLSWSSFDNPHEHPVAKCESSRELAAKFARNAVTQTDERMVQDPVTVELRTEDVSSSPPSNSSSEVLEGVDGSRGGDRTVEDEHSSSGRMKVSRVLMQLITCAGESVK